MTQAPRTHLPPETPEFRAWIALAFPWLPPHSPDRRNLRHAWQAGYEAGQKAGGSTP